jgi:hypothetical protein
VSGKGSSSQQLRKRSINDNDKVFSSVFGYMILFYVKLLKNILPKGLFKKLLEINNLGIW